MGSQHLEVPDTDKVVEAVCIPSGILFVVSVKGEIL